MARFDKSINTASRLIKKNGERSTLRRKSGETFVDATKPWEPTPAFIDTKVDAVWLDEDTARQSGFTLKDGQQMVLIPAKGLTITPDAATDILIRENDERWTVVRVQTLQPNTQIILHQVTVNQ